MNKPPIKVFNTAGPCVPSEHYMLPVLPKFPDVDEMIKVGYYFVLSGPLKSGKTTFLQSLTDKINADGQKYALTCSLATLRQITDRDEAMTRLAEQINRALKISGIKAFKDLAYLDDSLPKLGSSIKIRNFLTYLSVNLDKNLVVFFDAADCLEKSPLITFLAQIRDGYNERHRNQDSKFPNCAALVGMRDIRVCLTQASADSQSTAWSSSFNIVKKAFALANFTSEEIKALYDQHTQASGQVFEPGAIERVWHWSEGQPWLVNALAYEVVVKILQNHYSEAVTPSLVDQAAEALIQRRDTHFDYLRERLREPRVIRVMDPVFAGTPSKVSSFSDDHRYRLDLGLVIEGRNNKLRPANEIYKEIMPRVIADEIQCARDDKLAKTKRSDGKAVF